MYFLSQTQNTTFLLEATEIWRRCGCSQCLQAINVSFKEAKNFVVDCWCVSVELASPKMNSW